VGKAKTGRPSLYFGWYVSAVPMSLHFIQDDPAKLGLQRDGDGSLDPLEGDYSA